MKKEEYIKDLERELEVFNQIGNAIKSVKNDRVGRLLYEAQGKYLKDILTRRNIKKYHIPKTASRFSRYYMHPRYAIFPFLLPGRNILYIHVEYPHSYMGYIETEDTFLAYMAENGREEMRRRKRYRRGNKPLIEWLKEEEW